MWNYIKAASNDIFEVYKEGVQEFSQSLRQETKSAMDQWASSEPQSNQKSSSEKKSQRDIKMPSPRETRIKRLANVTDTFLMDPEAPEFQTWEGSISDYADTIPELLARHSPLKTMYDELVPSHVSSRVFWLRFFWRLEELDKAEEKRQQMVRQALEAPEENLTWDDDFLDDDFQDVGPVSSNRKQSPTPVATVQHEAVPTSSATPARTKNMHPSPRPSPTTDTPTSLPSLAHDITAERDATPLVTETTETEPEAAATLPEPPVGTQVSPMTPATHSSQSSVTQPATADEQEPSSSSGESSGVLVEAVTESMESTVVTTEMPDGDDEMDDDFDDWE